MNTSRFITEYEKTCANYLESKLQTSKVKLWADAFTTDSSAKTRNNIFFGHQRTDRTFVRYGEFKKPILEKTYTLELRVELFTLRNHQEALELIEFALDDILLGYQPYYEFTPFMALSSGQAMRNKATGSWVYSGEGITSIMSDVESLTSTDIPPEGRIIQVGLIAVSENNDVIGGYKVSE